MDKKVESISIAVACLVLLLASTLVFIVSFDTDVASGSDLPWYPGFPNIVIGTENVTWDLYVVGAYNTTSPPITPAPQPSGFNFTIVDGDMVGTHAGTGPGPVTGGFDYGTLGEYAERGYVSGWGWVKLNITNNLPQDVVITNLAGEVTNGTATETWPYIDIYDECMGDPTIYNLPPNATAEQCEQVAMNGNFSFVNFQSLDPIADEVDYYTGVVNPSYDATGGITDTTEMAWNQTNPFANYTTRILTLVGPDKNGDAAATGHVAPILLRAGETFSDYLAPGIFGNATTTTKIWGTVTLTLFYTPVREPTPLDVIEVVTEPEAYNSWTVQVNVTVRNTGEVSENFNLALYGLTKSSDVPINWTGGTWEQIGTTQNVTLSGGANTTLNFDWDLVDAPSPGNVSVRAIAYDTYNSTHVDYDELWGQITTILWGDINNNGGVDLGDIGKVILIYSGVITEPQWMVDRADMNGNGQVDLGDIGKVILVYSGILP